jgi:hypothetical protein
MIRRLFAATALAAALAAASAPSASANPPAALPEVQAGGGDAACIAIHPINVGYCQGNPLPTVVRIIDGLTP